MQERKFQNKVILKAMETILISLKLNTIDELFDAPEGNPLHYPGPYESGVDTIFNELHAAHHSGAVHLQISLPPAEVQPGLTEQVVLGLQRYCDFQIHKNEAEIKQTRHTGRRQFVLALPLMGVALLLTVFFAALAQRLTYPLFQALAGILATLFSVASWIVAWSPIDLLVYGWRPLRSENHLYERLRAARVEIIAAE
jgi:hypothetical protein